jgi:peptide-methionine (S)-S-oxide reductase
MKKMAMAIVLLSLTCACSKVDAAATIPGPAVDEHGGAATDRFAVFAGGCFWGVDAVFKHVKGVKNVVSGYSGGSASTAHYEIVSGGQTGHAESVQVVYDPSQISYGQLLQIFFSVAHDPTQLNQQGPDVGRQYRSAIFYADDTQRSIARAYIDQLDAAKVFRRRIVTEVTQLQKFYDAEAYHQGYFFNHPLEPYIIINDKPKVAALRQQFPELYLERR